jgi:hypothetical protein
MSTCIQKFYQPAETGGSTKKQPHLSNDPTHRSRIEKKASEIPLKYRQSYLRSVSGQAAPRHAIKAFCLECVCWQLKEVVLCPSVSCPLYPYRPYQNG